MEVQLLALLTLLALLLLALLALLLLGLPHWPHQLWLCHLRGLLVGLLLVGMLLVGLLLVRVSVSAHQGVSRPLPQATSELHSC
jgi:hypothetical protein